MQAKQNTVFQSVSHHSQIRTYSSLQRGLLGRSLHSLRLSNLCDIYRQNFVLGQRHCSDDSHVPTLTFCAFIRVCIHVGRLIERVISRGAVTVVYYKCIMFGGRGYRFFLEMSTEMFLFLSNSSGSSRKTATAYPLNLFPYKPVTIWYPLLTK